MYRQRKGNYEKVDSYEDNDMVKGSVIEVDAKGNPVEGGLEADGVVMLPKYFKDDKQKALFENVFSRENAVYGPSDVFWGEMRRGRCGNPPRMFSAHLTGMR